MVLRKAAYHSAVDAMLNCPGAGVTTNSTNPAGLANGTTTCPDGTVNPVIAIIGSAPSTPQAGYPEMVVPMGYTTTQRRNLGVDVFAGPYGERDIIGVGYVIEQATKLRKPVGEVNPSAYRCARTLPAEPYAARGHCNPDYTSVMSLLGNTKTILPFPLETTSAQALQAKLTAGTLTSQQLVKAELTRIALANANGPAVQAVRAINPDGARRGRRERRPPRAPAATRGPLDGIPVLVDDTISVTGLATSAGSIALQDNKPADDAALVAKLKAAGAVILGDTNVTELGGVVRRQHAAGLLVARRPGAAAVGHQQERRRLLRRLDRRGLGRASRALAVGMETGTDGAQLIAPAANAGVVALKPTVGLVSHDGVLPVATSQDAPGPIGQTVFDTAASLSALTGHDYTAGLSPTALSGKKIAVIANTTAPVPGGAHRAHHARARRPRRSRRGRRRPRPASSPLRAAARPRAAAGRHRLRHRARRRGPEVRPERADRGRRGDRRRRLRHQPRQGQGGLQGRARRGPGRQLGDPGAAGQRAGRHRRPRRLPGPDRCPPATACATARPAATRSASC